MVLEQLLMRQMRAQERGLGPLTVQVWKKKKKKWGQEEVHVRLPRQQDQLDY